MARRPASPHTYRMDRTYIRTDKVTGTSTTTVASQVSRKTQDSPYDSDDSTVAPDRFRAPNRYNLLAQEREYLFGTFSYQDSVRRHRYTGPLEQLIGNFSPSLSTSPLASYLRSRAEVGALLKMRNQKTQIAVMFAERAKTAALLSQSVWFIGRSVRDFRKILLRKLGRTFKNSEKPLIDLILASGRGASDRWLELQYGWIPTLSDVSGAIDAIASPPWQIKFYAKKHEQGYDRGVDVISRPFGSGSIQGEGHWDEIQGILVRIDAKSDIPETRKFSMLGCENPLEIVWELVPYSFIVDWFLPVGDYIGSLTATLNCTFRGGSYSVKTERVGKGFVTGCTAGSLLDFQEPNCAAMSSFRTLTFARTPYTGFPTPWSTKLPTFSNHKNIEVLQKRFWNGYALLWTSVFGGKHKKFR